MLLDTLTVNVWYQIMHTALRYSKLCARVLLHAGGVCSRHDHVPILITHHVFHLTVGQLHEILE